MHDKKNVLEKHVNEMRKPFKKYDVQNYDTLCVEGNHFPITELHKDLTIKAKRDPKIAMENKDLPERLRESGISVSASEESVLQNLLPYINYYRLDYCL